MLESKIWQKVGGTTHVEIYPYIRKIDLMSSNSYLISSKEQIALIDPGSLVDQMDHLIAEFDKINQKSARPLVIYLTHTHMDHCYGLREIVKYEEIGTVALAVQERGADALELQDKTVTLSNLLGREMEPISADVRLLSAKDVTEGRNHIVDVEGIKLEYEPRLIPISPTTMLASQSIYLGKNDLLTMYHTPGHSPDSICFQIGELLFIGDLLFAPNPGMAGIKGWHKEDFLATIEKILWMLDNCGIRLCCGGHGKPRPTEDIRRTLEAMKRDVMNLEQMAEMDQEWVKQTAAYAEDVMREMERLFAIIGGRMTYVSYVLDRLEVDDEARKVDALIDSSIADDLFDDFNIFAQELHAGKKLNWELVHKAGQIVGRLDRIIEQRNIGSLVDKSLLRRAERLINDYAITYRGYEPSCNLVKCNLNKALNEVVKLVMHLPYDEEAILNAKSEEDYIEALKARIAHVNLFENTGLVFKEDPDLPMTVLDRERFVDLVIETFERLISAGSKEIRISASRTGDRNLVAITSANSLIYNPFTVPVLRYYQRMITLSGGVLVKKLRGSRSPTLMAAFPNAN